LGIAALEDKIVQRAVVEVLKRDLRGGFSSGSRTAFGLGAVSMMPWMPWW